jgi:two-component system, chemotaxis family, CheB/CheR fusion protein
MEKAVLDEEDEACLAAIVESSEDAIIGKNLRSLVPSWNNGARRLLWYAPREMVGQSGSRIVPREPSGEEAYAKAS